MSQLVKTKRQTNFTDFKRFGAIKVLVKQKNVVFNSFVCKLGFLALVPLNSLSLTTCGVAAQLIHAVDLLIKKYLMPLTKKAENPTFRVFYRKIIITRDQKRPAGKEGPRRTGLVAKWLRLLKFAIQHVPFRAKNFHCAVLLQKWRKA
jgi:hypothetical protein